MAVTQEKPSTQSGTGVQQREGAGTPSQSGQQNLTRSSERGGLSRMGQAPLAFPSATEFFANPFSAMRRFQEDMDRMFSEVLGGGMGGRQGESGGLTTWSPAIEVKQKGNDLVVCAELPGLKPEEVQVEANDDALVIQGERKYEQASEEGGVHRTERRYGRFYRTIPLPEGAKTDAAKASFHDGMLEVTVPLPEQMSRRRNIPVTGGGGAPETKSGQRGDSGSGA